MRSKLFCSCFCAKKGTPGAVLGTSTITYQSVAVLSHLMAIEGIAGLQSMHITELSTKGGADVLRGFALYAQGLGC